MAITSLVYSFGYLSVFQSRFEDNFGYKRRSGVTDSYYFSQYAHVWGWATWRRAWEKYDVHMSNWHEKQDEVLAKFSRADERRYWKKQWDATYHNQIQTWAYQWLYACMLHDGLCIMPYENQISNIGMGIAATNTVNKKSPLANLPTQDIVFPLKHPQEIERDRKAERHAANLFWNKTLIQKIRSKMTRLGKLNWKKKTQN